MIHYSLDLARKQQPVGTRPFHQFVFDDGTVWTEFYRSKDGYILRFPGLADFDLALDGTAATGHPVPGTDEATVEHLYVNQVVPLALSRQGQPTFHASVVTVQDGAMAFLGRTGLGKSTLAASFALAGAAFLTDDALVIEESDEAIRALPSHPSLRLWEDSVEALVNDPELACSHVSFSTKTRLLAGGELSHVDSALPLLAAFVLDRKDIDDVAITPLHGSDRQMAWVQNSFLLDIEDQDLLAQHFDWTHRISGRVPTFALDYPRDYGMLPLVRQAIIDHVQNCA